METEDTEIEHQAESHEDWSLRRRRERMVASRFQAKAALAQLELLELVEIYIQGADQTARLAWQEALQFERLSPTLASVAQGLGLTDQQLDDLFALAATIRA